MCEELVWFALPGPPCKIEGVKYVARFMALFLSLKGIAYPKVKIQ